MQTSPLHYLTLQAAAALIHRRALSPVELTRAHLDRIHALDGRLKAYGTLLEEAALKQARSAEKEISLGRYRGPLHGIPIAYKDLFDTKGVRTTASSKVLEHRVPERDATIVARLRRAGAVVLGKLAMSEFAAGGPPTSLFEPSANPWNFERSPGGSSSGSGAAVAAGLAMGALGSDTGGSIRGPASFCGIVGLKPTYGRVSRSGVLPLSWSLDNAGPMTRTVEDTALMLQVIAGHDPKDLTSSKAPVPDYALALREELSGLTVGVPRHLYQDPESGVPPEVAAAVERAVAEMERLGARVEAVELPILRAAGTANTAIILSEAFAYHRPNLQSQPQNYGEIVRTVFYAGAMVNGPDYVQAQRMRSKALREIGEVMRRVDVLVMPSSGEPAPLVGMDTDPVTRVAAMIGMTSPRRVGWTGPFNLVGLPAISVPCGFTESGLPIGLQIVGHRMDEPAVLRVAYAYQQQTLWHQQHPPV